MIPQKFLDRSFWDEFTTTVNVTIDELQDDSDSYIKKIRQFVQDYLLMMSQQRSSNNNNNNNNLPSLFVIAWEAYTLCCLVNVDDDDDVTTIASQMIQPDSETPVVCDVYYLFLTCILVLESCCTCTNQCLPIATTDLDTTKATSTITILSYYFTNSKKESSFFPMLVHAAFTVLRRNQTTMMQKEVKSKKQQDLILHYIETYLLEDILGTPLYNTVIECTKTLQGSLPDSLRIQVDEQIQRYIAPPTKDNHNHSCVQQHYVNPLILFPTSITNDVTTMENIKKRFSYNNTEIPRIHPNELLNIQQQQEDKSPLFMTSLHIPFVRPLPPPLFPQLVGYDYYYDDDNDDDFYDFDRCDENGSFVVVGGGGGGGEEENNNTPTTTVSEMNTETMDFLRTEMIWCTPICNRLLLLPPPPPPPPPPPLNMNDIKTTDHLPLDHHHAIENNDNDDNAINDNDNILDQERYQEVCTILQNQAFVKPLLPNERRFVIDYFHNATHHITTTTTTVTIKKKSITVRGILQLLVECGLTPQSLPKLVEHNPLIAYECLLYILQYMNDDYGNNDTVMTKNEIEPKKDGGSKKRDEYLSSLVSMDMSLHCMEVMNRLAMYHITKRTTATTTTTTTTTTSTTTASSISEKPLLHPEYIHLFIGSCIASCENMSLVHPTTSTTTTSSRTITTTTTTTTNSQSRLVRLVCVFIQSLLRNHIITPGDIYFEVQSFCIEFSRIREASTLYKSLQQSITPPEEFIISSSQLPDQH